MVDIKFRKKDYMVDNIIKIIYSGLKEYIKIEDISFNLSNGSLIYIFNISNYYFEISYDFTDNFYRVKLEKKYNNQLQNIVFLTKSRKFKHDITLMIKYLELSRNAFENHINSFCVYVKTILKKYVNLRYLEEEYDSDLRFDGFFINN